jgi:YidC/Oxa1 family membrane protein insertase
MMYIMPVMFTFIFLKMPSGLVIYWLTQSLLTWAFQVYLLKRSPAAPEAAR